MNTYKVNSRNGSGQRIFRAYDLPALASTLGLGKVKITANKRYTTITTLGQADGHNTSYTVTEMSDEEALTHFQNERDTYVDVFIGDLQKPSNYFQTLNHLDAQINQLQCRK